MICPVTGKECVKPKLFHITEVKKSSAETVDLCSDCFYQYDFDGSKPPISAPVEKKVEPAQIKPAEIVKAMMDALGFTIGTTKFPLPKSKLNRTCPGCGISFDELSKTGKMGCAKCYKNFFDLLEGVIHHAQQGGKILHVGKVPKQWKEQANPFKYLEKLQRKIEKAIKDDRFEEASVLVKKMKELESLKERLENGDDSEAIQVRKEIKQFIKDLETL